MISGVSGYHPVAAKRATAILGRVLEAIRHQARRPGLNSALRTVGQRWRLPGERR